MTTFNLNVFATKKSLQDYINSLIIRRSQVRCLTEKGLLTQQIIILSECVELDYD